MWKNVTFITNSSKSEFSGLSQNGIRFDKVEERLSRSPGGKLALWAFYTGVAISSGQWRDTSG